MNAKNAKTAKNDVQPPRAMSYNCSATDTHTFHKIILQGELTDAFHDSLTSHSLSFMHLTHLVHLDASPALDLDQRQDGSPTGAPKMSPPAHGGHRANVPSLLVQGVAECCPITTITSSDCLSFAQDIR